MRHSIDAYRDEINARVEAALDELDSTDAAAVAMMTGFSFEELDGLGGLPKQNQADPPNHFGLRRTR